MSCQRLLWRHGPTEPIVWVAEGIEPIGARKHVACDLPDGYRPA